MDDDNLRPRLRVMQIICLALVLGVISFLGLALFLVRSRGDGLAPPAGLPLLSMLALVMLVANGGLALVLPEMMARNAIARIAQAPAGDDDVSLLTIRQTSLIVGMALWEGVAFLSEIAFLLEGNPLVLAVTGVAILFLLGSMPTMGRVQAWLERQQSRLAELRQHG